MARRALTTCSAGCGELVKSGRCDDCSRSAEQHRGNFRQRGYGRGHDKRFRPGVLQRDINCVLCIQEQRWTPATVADHWPLGRDELIARGMDPDDPKHGRGLCHQCHSKETAINQPGGFNA